MLGVELQAASLVALRARPRIQFAWGDLLLFLLAFLACAYWESIAIHLSSSLLKTRTTSPACIHLLGAGSETCFTHARAVSPTDQPGHRYFYSAQARIQLPISRPSPRGSFRIPHLPLFYYVPTFTRGLWNSLADRVKQIGINI